MIDLEKEGITARLIQEAVQYASEPTPGGFKGPVFIMVTDKQAKDIEKWKKKREIK